MKNENSQSFRYPIVFSGIESVNDSFARGFMRIAYTGDNPNGYRFSEEVFVNAIPSIYNCPIVVNYDRDSDLCGAHDIDIYVDKTGILRVANATHPIGIVPAGAKVYFEDALTADGVKRKYLCAEVLLWKRQEAFEHIAKVETIDQSMEIFIKRFHKDGDITVVEDMQFEAFCLLESAEPCFEGASLHVFSHRQSERFKNELKDMVADLRKECAVFDNKEPKSEEGEYMNLDKEKKLAILSELKIDEKSIDFNIDEDMDEETLRKKCADCVAKMSEGEEEREAEPETGTPDTGGGESDNDGKTEKTETDDDDEITKLKKRIKNLESEYDNYKNSHSHTNREYEELSSFKAEKLGEEHRRAVDAVLSEFTDLETVDEFAALKTEAYSCEDLDVLKTQCYAIRGKNMSAAQFSADKKDGNVRIPAEPQEKENTSKDELYGGLFKEFLK